MYFDEHVWLKILILIMILIETVQHFWWSKANRVVCANGKVKLLKADDLLFDFEKLWILYGDVGFW